MSESSNGSAVHPRVVRRRSTPPSAPQPATFDGDLGARGTPDLFYDTFADLRTCPPPLRIGRARALALAGRRRLPSAYERSARSLEDLLRGPHADSLLLLLGALSSWRCLTNTQAAALVGAPALGDPRGNLVADLYASDLIQLTNPFLGESLGDPSSGLTGYQIGNPKRLSEITAHLTWAESLAATGNRPRPTDPVHQRHDILCSELGIRFAEYLVCGTVLGPPYSHPRELAPHSPAARRASGSADLTLVRGDGLRVAIEVTSTTGQGFDAKIRKWIEILAESRLEDSGLCVVFLIAVSDAALSRDGEKVLRRVKNELMKATTNQPGSSRNRTAERIAVASWQQWFHTAHRASERFALLRVSRPNGPRERPWEEVDLWDPHAFPLTATDSNALRAVVANSMLLGQTHVALRWAASPAALAADLVRRHGGALPIVEPQRERSGTRFPGTGQGDVGGAVIPRLLLGPTDSPDGRGGHPLVDRGAPATRATPGSPRFGHRMVRRSWR